MAVDEGRLRESIRNNFMNYKKLFSHVAIIGLGLVAQGWAAPLPAAAFQTPLKKADLDGATYAEWVDGAEQKIDPRDARDESAVLKWVVWTQDTIPGHSGRSFGDSKTPGVRHLRIGLTQSKPVGTLIVGGNVTVSVLKPTAIYPGNLDDDSQWLPAQRIRDGKIITAEFEKSAEFTTWVLPPGTQTQALRLTHTAKPTDKIFSGWLGGVYWLTDRYVNIAPQAQAIVRSMTEKADRLNNESSDGFWGAWENLSVDEGNRAKTISEDPEWVMLVWAKPATLNGIALQFPGFNAAELDVYKGTGSAHPRDALDSDWEKLTDITNLKNLYPTQLSLNWIDFGKAVTTRALRLRITKPIPAPEVHGGHLQDKLRDGKRIWLGEWLALKPLGGAALETALPPVVAKTIAPKDLLIPVKFTLPEDGFVTLVIEDKTGQRVRNLVSETPFPKGDNIAWWDGTDDLGRDIEAAKHGVYHIPAQQVAPGEYRVRGLWRKAIHAYYEFGVYNAGNPPWNTADHTGAWLANHCAPMAAAFVPAAKSPTKEPAMFLGCWLTEGPDGLAWVDLDGKKRGGKGWIGGNWTTAPYVARDDGAHADEAVHLYVASVGDVDNGGDKKKPRVPELRVTALTKGADKPILRFPLAASQDARPDWSKEIGGLAASDGIVVCSLTKSGQLLFLNAKAMPDKKAGEILRAAPIESPRGIVFDSQGQLLVISGTRLLRIDREEGATAPKVVIEKGLEDPVGITLDGAGNIYISDRGTSHQVKVFTAAGKFLRAIGQAGSPQAGPYDPLHMNNPRGIAIDPNQHLWVTEENFVPKRVSVWTLDGKLVKAFYGPSKYGGGGTLDPVDKNRFYYADEGHGVMEFRLDWQQGTSQLVNILYRENPSQLKLPARMAAPEMALYRTSNGQKQRYFTNCYNSNPTGGSAAFLFLEQDHVIRPVAGMGQGAAWEELFKDPALQGLVPDGIDFKNGYKNKFFYIWSDLNGDGKVQANEMACLKMDSGGVTILPDFSFCVSRLGAEKEPKQAMRFAPVEFTAAGVPKYDFAKGQVIAAGVHGPASSGGDQLLIDDVGNFVLTLGVLPFHQYSISGGRNGSASWSYPNVWPGLHASHEAPKPDQPGQLVGTTRLVGGMFTLPGSDAGPLWAFTSSMGSLHFMTSDGLYVATPFQDCRVADIIAMPSAQRGINLDHMSLNGENFWPMVTQGQDGKVYLVDGNNTILIRLEGLETIRRIPSTSLTVTTAHLQTAQEYILAVAAIRKQEQGGGVMAVALNTMTPTVDGKLDDWATNWVEIDKSGAHAWFNSNTKPYNIRGAVAVADGKLFAAWETADPNLLRNTGEIPTAPFKTGGALELMIGTNPKADPNRKGPVAGDLRLLITQVKGKTVALIYRPVAPGTQTPKVPFSSPWRTISFDRVDDVSDKVQLAADGTGNYEISVPLDVLGLAPQPGLRIQGDIGILRGNGSVTLARTYWSNKVTGIVSDVPSEAELMPAFWGVWEFQAK